VAPRPEAAALARFHPVIEAVDGLTAGFAFERTADVRPDLTFHSVGLPPGQYFVRVPNPPDGWFLESVTLAGRDVSDVPLEVRDQPIPSIVIHLTDTPMLLGGTVQPATPGDALDADLVVVAFPEDRARWVDFGNTPRRLLSAVVSPSGAFVIRGLPPGEYYVAALRDDDLGDWRNPATLEALVSVAERVTMAGASQQVSVVLRKRR